jgi:hypothetical protein
MISKGWSRKEAMRTSAVLAASALAIGVAACGGSSGGSTGGSATKTVTVNQGVPAASQSAPAASQSAPAASQSGPPASQSAPAATQSAPADDDNSGSAGKPNAAVPEYRPASVVSKSKYSTVLTSPDSVSKIGSYYQGVLANGGWQLRSSSKTPYSASFTAHRASEGVTISVYPRGSGSGVSISTHPE